MTTQLTEKFETALVYATNLHRHQTRKVDGTPYIAHLLAVSAIILEAGGDEEEAIAGLLHDAIEDQGGAKTRAEIRLKFGERVTAIIDGCTESEITPKPPWIDRKKRYLSQLQSASDSVRLVSLADKLHNARSLLTSLQKQGENVWTFFKAGKQQTLWFYHSLLDIYAETQPEFLVQELASIISQIETG